MKLVASMAAGALYAPFCVLCNLMNDTNDMNDQPSLYEWHNDFGDFTAPYSTTHDPGFSDYVPPAGNDFHGCNGSDLGPALAAVGYCNHLGCVTAAPADALVPWSGPDLFDLLSEQCAAPATYMLSFPTVTMRGHVETTTSWLFPLSDEYFMMHMYSNELFVSFAVKTRQLDREDAGGGGFAPSPPPRPRPQLCPRVRDGPQRRLRPDALGATAVPTRGAAAAGSFAPLPGETPRAGLLVRPPAPVDELTESDLVMLSEQLAYLFETNRPAPLRASCFDMTDQFGAVLLTADPNSKETPAALWNLELRHVRHGTVTRSSSGSGVGGEYADLPTTVYRELRDDRSGATGTCIDPQSNLRTFKT